jgi:outer membrane protein TolC
MKRNRPGFFFLVFIFFVFPVLSLCGQQHDLIFYQNAAHQNNPVINENTNLQKYLVFQNELTVAQFRKIAVNFTADYALAPFFFNKGQFITITQNPDKSAFGYDPALSNGGLYAAQFNAFVPFFNKKTVNAYFKQNSAQASVLQNENAKLIHELDKQVSDQYIGGYQLQQEIFYLEKIIQVVSDRKKIVEALVQKGLMQQNDYLLLEIEINSKKYAIQIQKIALSNLFMQLNNLCGIRDTVIYPLEKPAVVQSLPPKQFNYYQKFQLDSLSLVSQQNIFNTKYRPQISAYGNAGLNSSYVPNISHNVGISAGLHLYIPIVDGGQRKTVESQNKLLLQTMQAYKFNNSIQVQNGISNLQQQINLTRQSLPALDDQLTTQETLLRILMDKVVTGQVSVTDYLVAVQDYTQTNQNKIQAQTNLWLLINQYNYINW